MAKKKIRTRTEVYKGHTITQTVEYKTGTPDGDGNEVRTTIDMIPNYLGFEAMYWKNLDMQKALVIKQMVKAQNHIDKVIDAKKPDMYEKLGFK